MAAPIISTRIPSSDATSVYLNKLIYITFDQAMDSTSLTDNTIIIYRTSDYEIVDKTISYDSSTYKVTLTPDIIFDKNTTYNVVVVGLNQSTTSVENSSDEGMTTTATWYFTTGAELYSAPEDTVEETQPDKVVAKTPVARVLEPRVSTDFTIVSTSPENYSSSLSTSSDNTNVTWGAVSPSGIQVVFNRPVASGVTVSQTWITLAVEAVDGDPSTTTAVPDGTVYNPNGNTLHWMPSDITGWKVNNEITVTVSEDTEDEDGNVLDDNYQFMFTTKYHPLYCSVSRIITVIGPFIRDMNNDIINRNIYFNSLEAYNIANTIYDQAVWDTDSPTFAAKMWVCCKTQYDLLYAKLLDLSQGGPGQLKRLGDFTIQDTGDINSGIKGALQKALDCMNAWMKQLLGRSRRAKAQMVVKGVSSAVTPPMRGVRTWSVPTASEGLGGNKRISRRIKSPGPYSEWS